LVEIMVLNLDIVTSQERRLVGKLLRLSWANYRVAEVWSRFMPERKDIKNSVSEDLISMAVYDPGHFSTFNPDREFEKWAAVEVADFDQVPITMETYVIPAGLYAVFKYKGRNTDNSIFEYIFNVWLPESDYLLDDRPHFEVLGENYKNDDPDSEEKIWIPVKLK
jgi:AraC family transcriptional regulator